MSDNTTIAVVALIFFVFIAFIAIAGRIWPVQSPCDVSDVVPGIHETKMQPRKE